MSILRFLSMLLIVVFPINKGRCQDCFAARETKETPADWHEYHPLALGNSWMYQELDSYGKAAGRRTTWEVVNVTQEDRGRVFWIWPKPSEGDEEYWALLISELGLREVGDSGNEYYLIRSPLEEGKTWKEPLPSETNPYRVFKILSLGRPCRAGKFRFSDCMIVEEDRGSGNLRIVRTYARHVGPVRFEYFGPVESSKGRGLIQVAELVSYKLSGR